MPYLIIKEGRSERERRVYGRVASTPSLREKASAHARNVDEAADIAYHELRDREDAKPIIVEGGDEPKKAFDSMHSRMGFDPDKLRHDWGMEK